MMLATSGSVDRIPPNAVLASQDLTSCADAAFGLICEVEKWPVWLSLAKTARRLDESQPLRMGSEVALRGAIPGEAEQLFEVDRFLEGYVLSLVGAFSVRRRLDFRVERKGPRTKLVMRVEYPSYGGALGALIDRMTARRRLETALEESLVHFKGLVEFKDAGTDAVLSDF
jgi:uncharacterized membrane protein